MHLLSFFYIRLVNLPNSMASGSAAPISLLIRPRPGSSPGPFVPSPGSGSRPMSPGTRVESFSSPNNKNVLYYYL